MVAAIVWTYVAVAVAVEACHRLLAEETKRLLEDWVEIVNCCSGILGEVGYTVERFMSFSCHIYGEREK